MQYIDKNGQRHDIPLHTVQPIVSPDEDNVLHETANGLKVSKSEAGGGGIGNVTMRTAEVTFVLAQEVKSFSQCPFTVAKRDIMSALNLQPNEHILGGDDAYNFVRVITNEDFCPVSYWYDGGSSYIGFTAVNGSPKDWYVRSIRLTYYIVTEE